MEERRKHIDDLFREGLENYRETPGKDLWASLEQRLPGGDAVVARQPSYRWLWILALLALLASVGYFVVRKMDEPDRGTNKYINENGVPGSGTSPSPSTVSTQPSAGAEAKDSIAENNTGIHTAVADNERAKAKENDKAVSADKTKARQPNTAKMSTGTAKVAASNTGSDADRKENSIAKSSESDKTTEVTIDDPVANSEKPTPRKPAKSGKTKQGQSQASETGKAAASDEISANSTTSSANEKTITQKPDKTKPGSVKTNVTPATGFNENAATDNTVAPSATKPVAKSKAATAKNGSKSVKPSSSAKSKNNKDTDLQNEIAGNLEEGKAGKLPEESPVNGGTTASATKSSDDRKGKAPSKAKPAKTNGSSKLKPGSSGESNAAKSVAQPEVNTQTSPVASTKAGKAKKTLNKPSPKPKQESAWDTERIAGSSVIAKESKPLDKSKAEKLKPAGTSVSTAVSVGKTGGNNNADKDDYAIQNAGAKTGTPAVAKNKELKTTTPKFGKDTIDVSPAKFNDKPLAPEQPATFNDKNAATSQVKEKPAAPKKETTKETEPVKPFEVTSAGIKVNKTEEDYEKEEEAASAKSDLADASDPEEQAPTMNSGSGGSGGGGGGSAPLRNFNKLKFEGGIKVGYDLGLEQYTSRSFIFAPYLKWNISERIGVSLQPGFKYNQLSRTNIGADIQSYHNVISATRDSAHVIIPDSLQGMDSIQRNYIYRNIYDSLSIGQKMNPQNYWEIELPLMLHYRIADNLSVFAGLSMTFGNLISINEDRRQFSGLQRLDTLSYPTVLDTQSIYPNPPAPQGYFSYNTPDITTAPPPGSSQSPSNNPARFGYMFGLSYELRRKWIFDLMVRQTISDLRFIPNEQVRKIYAQPYFRFMIGYRLFNSGSRSSYVDPNGL